MNTQGAQRRDERRAKRKQRKADIRAFEDHALAEMETGSQAVRDYASRQPTYEELLGDMPTRSQIADVQDIDPRLRAAQDRALARLETIGNEGYTQEERAALDAAQRQTALQERAQREAVMQQAGANRNADIAAQIGMAGRDRALAAIETGANLAGSMDAQRFGQQATRAGAIDAFNQWATGHRSAARQQTFDNAGSVAGLQTSWAPQVAGFYQDRANAMREQQKSKIQRFGQGFKGLVELGTNLGMGIARLKQGGGSSGAP